MEQTELCLIHASSIYKKESLHRETRLSHHQATYLIEQPSIILRRSDKFHIYDKNYLHPFFECSIIATCVTQMAELGNAQDSKDLRSTQ